MEYQKTNYSELEEITEIALWERTSQNGKKYLSGTVDAGGLKFKVVAFQNEKTKDNQPDWKFSQKKEQ